MQLVDEGGDADEDGEKGEDEEIGQLGGGPAHPFGEVHVHHIGGKADGGMGPEQAFQLLLHGGALLPVFL